MRKPVGQLLVVWLVGAGILPAQSAPGVPAATEDATAETAPAIDLARIQQWVRELDADSFSVRNHATEQLIKAGQAAVEPVAAAVESGSLETITRGIYVLREMTLAANSIAIESAAYEALQKIADRRVTTASRKARATLTGLDEARQLRARQYLEQQGADFSTELVQVADRFSRPFPTIQFSAEWTGTEKDLQQLRWATRHVPKTVDGNQVMDKWCIVLSGPQVTNDWLGHLQALENVTALKIKRTSITDTGLAALQEMKDLQFVELLYNPITEQAIDHLAQLQRPERIKVYGAYATPAAAERLQQQLANVAIDFRQGAFLGIGGDENPQVCRISQVQPGTAAERAGLQPGDIIAQYDGHPVKNFDELTARIARNGPGDTVTIQIIREGQTLSKQVTLGEWE